MKFCILRNDDNTLTVYFSDNHVIHCVEDKHIDDVVFGYAPECKQVFSLESFKW